MEDILAGHKVSSVVPVFNEEKTVASVVGVLLSSSYISEVVCVNDGSTDKSLEILRSFGDKITLVNVEENKGKGAALAKGIKRATGDVIVLFDADLVNFSKKHISILLKPLLEGTADVVLGSLQYGEQVPLKQPAAVTGHRAYWRKDLLPFLDQMSETRFGVEILLNRLFRDKKIKKVFLKGLLHIGKMRKHGSVVGILEEANMIKEIITEIGKTEVILPEDFKLLDKIPKAHSSKELKKLVARLKNKNIKKLLNEYFLKYLNLPKDKFS